MKTLIFSICLFCCLSASWAQLSWEATNLEIQANYQDKDIPLPYSFTNTSDQPITITAVRTSCGCTAAKPEKDTYAPGETGTLMGNFNIGTRTGSQRKSITVTTNEAENNSYSLSFTVHIPQALTVKPRMIFWRKGDDPKAKSLQVDVVGAPEVSLKTVRLAGPNFSHKILNLSANQKEIVIEPLDTSKSSRETIFLEALLPDGTIKTYSAYVYIR